MDEDDLKKFEEVLGKYETTEFDNFDPKVNLSLVGYLLKTFNLGGINYDSLLKDFKLLENNLGEISVFAIGDVLKEEMKAKRYNYLMIELIHISIKSIGIIFRYMRHNLPKLEGIDLPFLNRIKNLGINYSNEDLITRYCREWEIQFNTFINPVFKKLEKQNLLSKCFKYKGRQSEIDAVSKYLEENDNLKSFNFFTQPLNAKLRNSLVHCNYFFDKDGEELFYYDRRRKKAKINIITTKDLELKTLYLIIQRLIFTVRMSQKLAEELGIEW